MASLADLLAAQCYYVAAPALADTKATRGVLIAQPMLRDVFERGEKVDLAFLSVGDLTPASTVTRVGLITRRDAQELLDAGAVGDICAHWIDRHGRIVDHPLNSRVVALSPAKLPAIRCVIVASGGRAKVIALAGVRSGGMVNVLITDDEAARGVLALADSIARARRSNE